MASMNECPVTGEECACDSDDCDTHCPMWDVCEDWLENEYHAQQEQHDDEIQRF